MFSLVVVAYVHMLGVRWRVFLFGLRVLLLKCRVTLLWWSVVRGWLCSCHL